MNSPPILCKDKAIIACRKEKFNHRIQEIPVILTQKAPLAKMVRRLPRQLSLARDDRMIFGDCRQNSRLRGEHPVGGYDYQ
jgi:hypothetical protein